MTKVTLFPKSFLLGCVKHMRILLDFTQGTSSRFLLLFFFFSFFLSFFSLFQMPFFFYALSCFDQDIRHQLSFCDTEVGHLLCQSRRFLFLPSFFWGEGGKECLTSGWNMLKIYVTRPPPCVVIMLVLFKGLPGLVKLFFLDVWRIIHQHIVRAHLYVLLRRLTV